MESKEEKTANNNNDEGSISQLDQLKQNFKEMGLDPYNT